MTKPAVPDSPRWWYCTQCQAINDGLEQSDCWNCGRVQRKRKHFPWVEMGTKHCDVCRKSYVTWTLPPDVYLKGEPYEMGVCIDYFEHYGQNAYYPPMLPLAYVLDANGWRYDEKKGRPVKARRAPE